MTSVRRFLVVTLIATLTLIAIGGFVRASGSGLGCPDWPKCFERWVPPTDVSQLPEHIPAETFNFTKAWTEYLNRLAGVILGFIMLATQIVTWRHARGVPGVFWPVLGASALVIFQGWFGGQVVKHELDPRLVTVHLVAALLMLAMLLLAVSRIWGGPWVGRDALAPERRPVDRWAMVGLVLVMTQVLLGALVRGEVDLVIADRPDLCRSMLLGEVGWVHLIHREAAIAVGLGVLLLWRAARASGIPSVRKLGHVAAGCTLAQAGAGIGLAYASLPPALQVVHLSLSAWLFSAIFLMWALNRRS